jgi:3-deoxy-D-manno-octulosonate 8-phosphate phosphatase (KDO 8-P phosphatase)
MLTGDSKPGNEAIAVPDFARIAAVSFDIDGVLTDGGITYSDDGRELKTFNVQDGSALKMLMEAGIAVAFITGRTSAAVERRAKELGVQHLYQGQNTKTEAFAHFLKAVGVEAADAAHVGDDLPDLAVFAHCGLGIAVPNAHPAVIARAGHVTHTPGGHGVARELAELMLRARGLWAWDTTR